MTKNNFLTGTYYYCLLTIFFLSTTPLYSMEEEEGSEVSEVIQSASIEDVRQASYDDALYFLKQARKGAHKKSNYRRALKNILDAKRFEMQDIDPLIGEIAYEYSTIIRNPGDYDEKKYGKLLNLASEYGSVEGKIDYHWHLLHNDPQLKSCEVEKYIQELDRISRTSQGIKASFVLASLYEQGKVLPCEVKISKNIATSIMYLKRSLRLHATAQTYYKLGQLSEGAEQVKYYERAVQCEPNPNYYKYCAALDLANMELAENRLDMAVNWLIQALAANEHGIAEQILDGIDFQNVDPVFTCRYGIELGRKFNNLKALRFFNIAKGKKYSLASFYIAKVYINTASNLIAEQPNPDKLTPPTECPADLRNALSYCLSAIDHLSSLERHPVPEQDLCSILVILRQIRRNFAESAEPSLGLILDQAFNKKYKDKQFSVPG